MKKLLNYCGVFGIAIIGYILVVTLGHQIPNAWYHQNMVKAVESIEKQGIYPQISAGIAIDNYTDLLILGVANYEGKENTVIEAIKNGFAVSEETDFANLDGLKKELRGEKTDFLEEARYGGVISVVVKILLIFMTIEQIRTVFFLTCIMLFLVVLYMMYQRFGTYITMCFGISYVGTGFLLAPLCMGFFSNIFITLVIMVCVMRGKRDLNTVFLLGGILTYCSDYLSLPLLTVCYPLILLMIVTANKYKMKERWNIIVVNTVLWGVGYVIPLGIKSIISKLIFKSTVAENKFLLWAGITEHYTVFMRLKRILRVGWNYFKYTDILYMLIPVTIIVGVMLLQRKIRLRLEKKENLVLYGFICLYPLVWPFLFPVHAMHGFIRWMFAPSLMGIMCMMKIENANIDSN